MFKNLKQMSIKDKVTSAVSIVASISVIVLVVLQLTNIWKDSIRAYMPLMCISMICQAIKFWKESKATAVVSLISAIITFAGSMVVWVI